MGRVPVRQRDRVHEEPGVAVVQQAADLRRSSSSTPSTSVIGSLVDHAEIGDVLLVHAEEVRGSRAGVGRRHQGESTVPDRRTTRVHPDGQGRRVCPAHRQPGVVGPTDPGPVNARASEGQALEHAPTLSTPVGAS